MAATRAAGNAEKGLYMVNLTIKRPEHEEEVVTFDQPVEATIGRSAGCTFCLDFDPMVSRMHAVFIMEPPMIRIKDLNSTNGLVINGKLIGGYGSEKPEHPIELHNDDEVMIGNTLFKIAISDGASSGTTRAIRYGENSTVISSRSVAAGDVSQADEGMEETVNSMAQAAPAIPGHRIKGLLGTGRMGEVYQAVSRDTGEMVAIKMINPGVEFTKKMLDDFKAELEQARGVRHPHFVRLLGAGATNPKTLYLILEFVNGEDLGSYRLRCPNGRVPLHAAYKLMLQMASTLCYAHSHGIVHRDLKPQSVILYDDNGVVMTKITDVGLVKFLEDSGITTFGTHAPDSRSLAYTAPEQLSELRDSKPTADVFALSAIFYEMLTGEIPYDFPHDNYRENMEIVANAAIVPIEERLPGLPEPLVVIIDRGLSNEPEERYQSCCDLLEALENVRV